ncbi:MAG: hypothetical protein V1893_02420 [Candidatus Omnitrophota bacterium]
MRFTECRESAASWLFLFVGLLATIAVRLVNVFLDFNPLWAKIFWYIGIAGFFIYFLYKFKKDRALQKELARIELTKRLSEHTALNAHDYSILTSIVCQLRSNKDMINYFFIFSTSALALCFGIYHDFIKKNF